MDDRQRVLPLYARTVQGFKYRSSFFYYKVSCKTVQNLFCSLPCNGFCPSTILYTLPTYAVPRSGFIPFLLHYCLLQSVFLTTCSSLFRGGIRVVCTNISSKGKTTAVLIVTLHNNNVGGGYSSVSGSGKLNCF